MSSYMCFLETGVPWLSADDVVRQSGSHRLEGVRFPSSSQMEAAVRARKLWLQLVLEARPATLEKLPLYLERDQADLLTTALVWYVDYLTQREADSTRVAQLQDLLTAFIRAKR